MYLVVKIIKKIQHTTITEHFKSIKYQDHGINIKLIYPKLNC